MIGIKHCKNIAYGAKIISVSAIVSILIVQNAFAYIDPGSGAIAVQMLMAALATGVGYVIIFYRSIKVKIQELKARFFGASSSKDLQVDEKVEPNTNTEVK